MNTAHLHLIVNHLPVLGSLFGLALLAVALLRGSTDLRRAALVTLALAALSATPAMLTGEGAEHAVEHLPGVTEKLIERHEDAAGAASAVLGVAGVLAFAALVLEWLGRPVRALAPAVLVAGLGGLGVMSYAAALGGQIRHTEIRGGAAAVTTASPGREHGKHDDDD